MIVGYEMHKIPWVAFAIFTGGIYRADVICASTRRCNRGEGNTRVP